MVFTRPGFGQIFAEASVSGQAESDITDNRTTLNLRVN
jgi:hypothetical protein